jgi:phospholipid N-methyltransferase
MDRDSQLFLFELDPAFSRDLERQFADDPRVHVINRDAASLSEELALAASRSAITFCPASLQHSRDQKETRSCSRIPTTRSSGRAFIIYQVTNELRQHATFFDRAESEYCLQNIPPMFITVFQKAQTRNGHARIAPATSRISISRTA